MEDKDEKFSLMMVCAARYGIGRMTYITHSISEYLIANWDKLTTKDQAIIVRDITEAIADNRAGMECDVESWGKVLDRAAK